jgi:hypothetical protein
LRFLFLDDVIYESASSREHQALRFGNFWWGFWFFKIFLLSHTHFTKKKKKKKIKKEKHLCNLLMCQLEVGVGISILLIACIGPYLPSSIPHPLEAESMLPLTFFPGNGAKMLGSKDV